MRTLALVVLVLVVSGCAGDEPGAGPTALGSFYPLAWAVEEIAGPETRVVNLTPAGADPHDIELTPRDIEAIRDAELVVYLSGGFQPAVEDAVAQREGPSLDVVSAGETDPHVWLDPVRFSLVAQRIGRALGRSREGRRLAERLGTLDALYRRGLRRCERRTIVTTHASFGRLAQRYGLTQLSLAGRSPEAEPGPRELEDLIEKVRASGATTVFAEPLVSDRLARTVAREADVEVSVLDPLEGLSEAQLDGGANYFSVMRSNLAALREALGCS